MIKSLSFISFLLFAVTASAFIDPLPGVNFLTMDEPDLICQSKGVEKDLDDLVLFIDVNKKQVAQAGQDALDVQPYSGLQIIVEENGFQVERCDHCYSIKGNLAGMGLQIDIEGTSEDKAKGTLLGPDYQVQFTCDVLQ